MEDHINIIIDEYLNNVRLDRYLADELPDQSRSYIQGLIKSEKILVNGLKTKASRVLNPGDVVDIFIPEPEKLEIMPADIPLDIVYEDEAIIVVNKPQGMVVHPAPGHYDDTLVNALMYHCESLSGINGMLRPGIVHRIDRDTSGLLVVCKTDAAHRALSEQFSTHSITRKYYAICLGSFKEENGTVDKPIARAKNDRKRMTVDENGRRAVTHYHVEKKLNNDHSFISCNLETGRTHQIRVHMSYIKHPILGDPVYGPKKCPYNLNGQLLHAGFLGFIHPVKNEYVEFQSELPEHFKKILKDLTNIAEV